MYFKLALSLKINGKDYSKYFSSASIVSDRNATGDAAQISVVKSKSITADTFSAGDEIELNAGYDRYGLAPEFSGVIVEAGPQSDVIELRCEDHFYSVRQRALSRHFRNMALDAIIAEASGFPVEKQLGHIYPVISVGAWSKISARAFIMQLVKKHGYIAAFAGRRLFVFKNNYSSNYPYPEFVYGRDILESDLSYHRSENIGCVNVVSENEYGYLVKSHFGSPLAQNSRTIHLEGLSLSDAAKRAKEIYDELNFEGLRGNFKTCGYPPLKHSRLITIYPEGPDKPCFDQIVDKIETTISATEGFVRVVYPAKIIPEKVRAVRRSQTTKTDPAKGIWYKGASGW